MSNRVNVLRYFQGLFIETGSFAFEVKVDFGLKSTIPGGWSDGRVLEELGIKPTQPPIGIGLGLGLCLAIKRSKTTNLGEAFWYTNL